MFLRLWNYLRGYVIIEVSGFSTERFINLALHKGICFWTISQSPKGIFIKVSLKNFKQLKDCAKKSKCKIKIKKRCGVPFFIFKNRKRYLFSSGIIIFVVLLYTLSSFIWQINVEGNSMITEAEILTFCEENGFKTGTYKKNLNTKELIRLVKNNFPNISWVTIRIEGTLATIKIAESINPPKITDTSKPCNIIADYDGIITEIITSKGTPKVKINDVVKKGDVLVASELTIKNDETGILTDYVHSIADIKAKQWYNININVPLEYETKKFTQNTKTLYDFKILENQFGFNFLKNRIYFKNYDTIITEKQLKAGKNFALPISIIKNEYNEYNLISQTRSEEDAKKIAENKLNYEIINNFSSSCEIIDKKLNFSKTQTELNLNASVIIIDNIGKEQYLTNIEGSTGFDGTGKNTNSE